MSKLSKQALTEVNLEVLLPAVLQMAQQAGKKILSFYRVQDLGVAHKSDASPVTAADIAAHEYILTGLQKLTPTWPVLSEEGEIAAYDERKKWSHYWLVDPLDGTKGFLAGNDEFTVNIALIVEHQPIIGVIYSPVDKVSYFGAYGFGAFKQLQDSEPKGIKTRGLDKEDFRVLTARVHIDKKSQQLLQTIGPYERIALNSSVKFGLLAEGMADFYPRLHEICEWDIAAGHCILQAAGGELLDFNLESMQYNRKESLLLQGFVAVGDRTHNWKFLREYLAL